ncbi:Nuclear pore complex protein NUP50A [Bienertia sinuspersici]
MGDENQPSKKELLVENCLEIILVLMKKKNNKLLQHLPLPRQILLLGFVWFPRLLLLLLQKQKLLKTKQAEDADTKDDANSESQANKVEPEEKPSKVKPESNADQVTEAPTEQEPVISQSEQAVVNTAEESAETKSSNEQTADDSAQKAEQETAGEVQGNCEKTDNDAKNENEKADASGVASLNSFQQLSNNQNAFTGLTGTGFSTSTFSFGSLQKDGSPSQSSFPTFSFGNPTNGSTPLFGTVMAGTSIGTKTESSAFRSMQEVPTETGEENEDTVFSADSALFEFFDGGWKERGKGEVKLNLLKGENQKARLVMRTKGNLRLILNACLFPDMKLTKMDKKGVTFACVNIAAEGKDGLSTFALKFKDSSIMEEFSSAVSAHKDKPANTSASKTPENSPKASDD